MTLQAKDKQISASELRIGNWINLYGDDCRVQTIGQWIHTETTVDEAPISSARPIVLTSEWLERAGFEPNGVFKSMRLPIEPLRTHGSRTFIVIAHDGGGWIEIIDRNVHDQYKELQSPEFQCKYVHSLQNLFYALTGTELTLKEARDERADDKQESVNVPEGSGV